MNTCSTCVEHTMNACQTDVENLLKTLLCHDAIVTSNEMNSRIVSRLNECTSSVTVKTGDDCFCFLVNSYFWRYTSNSKWFVLYWFNYLICLQCNYLLIVYLIWRHDHEYKCNECKYTNSQKNCFFHNIWNKKQKAFKSCVCFTLQECCERLSWSCAFL